MSDGADGADGAALQVLTPGLRLVAVEGRSVEGLSHDTGFTTCPCHCRAQMNRATRGSTYQDLEVLTTGWFRVLVFRISARQCRSVLGCCEDTRTCRGVP